MITFFQNQISLEPLFLTLRIAVLSLILHFITGITTGYFFLNKNSFGAKVIDVLVTIPLFFPPIAIGFILLLLLGRNSFIGIFFKNIFCIDFIFTFTGLVTASFVAGLPLIVKSIQNAVESFDNNIIEASYSLGKSKLETYFFIIIPNIKNFIASGVLLAFGRSIGEVGITLMLGGNIQGKTDTISLAIYNSVFSAEYAVAAFYSIILGIISFFALILFKNINNSGPEF
jgi:molybdate transport system permease protein